MSSIFPIASSKEVIIAMVQTSVRGTKEYGGKINYGDRVSQTKFKMLSIFPITSLK